LQNLDNPTTRKTNLLSKGLTLYQPNEQENNIKKGVFPPQIALVIVRV
jgi:hypothetical protein